MTRASPVNRTHMNSALGSSVNSGLVWKHHEAVGAAIYKVCFITSKLHFCGRQCLLKFC